MRKHSQSPAIKENQITEICLLDISKDGYYWILVKMAIDVVLYRLNSYKYNQQNTKI
jgi:hypothetical protein